ncbi:hypothetical protein K1719_027528 [Acacia pycnantha]|nr:hypothetical protein K1719_027528 [Acacia pycnantha]
MESNILKLQEKVKEAENVIRSLREKAHDEAVHEKVKEPKLGFSIVLWPVVAASTGAIAIASVAIYVCYGKRT